MRALNSQDFALLSDHIYGKKDKNDEVKLVFDNEKNKEITLNGIKYAVEKISDNPKNGYFGAIYRRLDTNELVVVQEVRSLKHAKTEKPICAWSKIILTHNITMQNY